MRTQRWTAWILSAGFAAFTAGVPFALHHHDHDHVPHGDRQDHHDCDLCLALHAASQAVPATAPSPDTPLTMHPRVVVDAAECPALDYPDHHIRSRAPPVC